ncbi:MAG: hypothetical protein ACXWYT_07140 [Actinomycetota bacterium]
MTHDLSDELLAARRGAGYQTLLKEFVSERLYEEEKRRGVQPRHQSLLQLRDAQPLRRGDRLVIEGDRQPAICISRITL